MEYEALKKEIDAALKEMELYVTDINFREENKYKFLTIELDNVSGIDLDTIVEATHIINPIIDTHDICDDSYVVDIISKPKGSDE